MSFSLRSTATKTLALAIATSFMVTTALPVSQAEAGKRKHWKNNHGGYHATHHHHKKRHKKRRNRGSSSDALAAGVIGFAIGAILADQAHRPRTVYVQPQPVYRQPQPVYRQPLTTYSQPQPVYREPIANDYNDYNSYDEPQVIRYEDTVNASYEPWSQEWARWCDNKYRSFNVRTGTFRGYDGRDHFCVVK